MTHPHIPQIAGRGVIVQHDKLLLVRGDGDGRFWTLPGGRMELGEGIEACVVREVFEETGLTVTVGPLFAVSEFYDEAIAWHILQMMFFAEVTSGALQGGWIDHGGPVQEARFFTLGEIQGLETVFPKMLRQGTWLQKGQVVYHGIEINKMSVA